LNKQFGVYTFDDNKPLFEKKARLIERLVAKKNETNTVAQILNDAEDAGSTNSAVDKSKVKVRSIPGGIGHQIVFSTKSEREQQIKLQQASEQ
jgi:hypothetical protein